MQVIAIQMKIQVPFIYRYQVTFIMKALKTMIMITKELYNVNILRVKTTDILSYHLSNQNECHLSGVVALQKLYFSPVESAAANKEGIIFKNMSSYQDLKYLVKELRRWDSGKRIVSFGMSKLCAIVPPNKLSSMRKAAFITWTTSELGVIIKRI